MPDMQVVRSRENPHVRQLDSLLRRKKAREESGLFVLEGSRLCLDAVDAGLCPQSVMITPGALQKTPELKALIEAALQTIWIDETLAERVSEQGTTQGVFAILEQTQPATLEMNSRGRYLLLHEVRDPGNLGGILRTAAALGVSAAFLCGCVELYSPKTLRASMGGVFRLPVVQTDDIHGQIRALREVGIEVFATALREGARLPACLSESGGKAIVIGNEGAGLPEEVVRECTGSVAIPMQGGTQSLNAAMAAGILLWEMMKYD
ncbi:MAG: RNA methyltransferase [Oscillospiraceae bacterium]|nr:RNA methyltransferase [Oscillospiraceae bacterium]